MMEIEAIYQESVFRPLAPVSLEEGQRVRLTIRSEVPMSKEAVEEWLKRVQLRQEAIAKREGVLPDSTPGFAEDRLR